MPFLSGTSVVSLIIRPVMLPTGVHLEFMAFPSRSSVPLLITNSKKELDIVYGIDYVNVREFSRRREGLSYRFQCIVRSKSSYRCHCILNLPWRRGSQWSVAYL
ncbi:hypothetical protein T12_15259 [Trichinella patagoniensis]|uniref:Uncharacterized protein n=1 Tax=Trichinella patagoniensis TaxID=990121 RepID=A0A0V1A252_9BILA|nr:hypothetical protein T12_15259 [Trichinella patagoniensis]